jgi:hypothetical protein
VLGEQLLLFRRGESTSQRRLAAQAIPGQDVGRGLVERGCRQAGGSGLVRASLADAGPGVRAIVRLPRT